MLAQAGGAVQQLECRSTFASYTLSRDCHVIIETFVFRQESVCTDVLGSRNVLPEFM